MRNLFSYMLLSLLVIAFFVIVALEHYAWSSWHAYTTVHAWESLVVIVLFFGLSLLAGVATVIDWCYYRAHKFLRKTKKQK